MNQEAAKMSVVTTIQLLQEKIQNPSNNFSFALLWRYKLEALEAMRDGLIEEYNNLNK
jgi:hypothetical protein